MSIVDFITGLCRDPANLRAYLDDPDRALAEAGLGDVSPEEVQSLLPTVAESMPWDHPLQLIAYSKAPQAIAQLDVEELCGPPVGDKVIGQADSDKALGPAGAEPIVDPTKSGKWESAEVDDKDIGSIVDDPPTADIEDGFVEAAQQVDEPNSDKALDADIVEPDFGQTSWGKALE